MNVFMTIADVRRAPPEWDDGTIKEVIEKRRRGGLPVCVQVEIKVPCADMRLSTPTCSRAGGGGRPPNPCETRVFDLWRTLNLDRIDFPITGVIAFKHKVGGLLN